MAGAAVLATHHDHGIQVVRVVHHLLSIVRGNAVLAALKVGAADLETCQHLLLILGQRHEALGRGQIVGYADGADGLLRILVSALPRQVTVLLAVTSRHLLMPTPLTLSHRISQAGTA